MDLVQPRLGVALCGLEEPEFPRQARARLEWAAGAGFRAVALDASASDTRPRDLDRSARRGVAATLRRLELDFAGFDLWIPASHFTAPTTADRALAALQAALRAAAEIADLAGGSPVVSAMLPTDSSPDVLDSIDREAIRVGAVVADHAWPENGRHEAHAGIRCGLDPAGVLASGDDPVRAAGAAGARLALARLSDLDASGRVPIGEGRLDIDAYVGAVAASAGLRTLVLDLRGVRRQRHGADIALGRLGSPVR